MALCTALFWHRFVGSGVSWWILFGVVSLGMGRVMDGRSEDGYFRLHGWEESVVNLILIKHEAHHFAGDDVGTATHRYLRPCSLHLT